MGEKAERGAERGAERTPRPDLKALAAQVLARAAARNGARNDARNDGVPGRSAGEGARNGRFLAGNSGATDWRAYFDERAAIREHDGGASRADAEAGALADCVAWWRALNPLPASGRGVCAHCGADAPDLPVLAPGGHAWLHRACLAAMNAARGREARAAVLALLAAETAPEAQETSTLA